ncbi:MAG: hypothetical protein LBI33_01920 [Propionibacteriaceae bacterium]|nr:hypothetical protein [Propionibacteriaceae bacterium]
MSPVNMKVSAYKHGFELTDAIYVMTHPVGSELIRPTPRGEEWAFVGYPYEGSDRRMELLAEIIPPRTVEVFHFMDLTDYWRHLWTTS